MKFLRGDEEVMLITEKGMIIRLNTADISTIGRNTQGVRLIQLEEGDHLVSVARLAEREDEDEEPAQEPLRHGPTRGGAMRERCDGHRAAILGLWPSRPPAAARDSAWSTSTSTPSTPRTTRPSPASRW